MAIKTAPILTREDYNEAQVTLGLTYAEVAKEIGIPRQYLSEFRGGTRNLLPEQQRKVRSFFEDRGIVFEDYADNSPTAIEPPAKPAPIVAEAMPEGVHSTSITCLHFAIDPDIQPTELRKIARQIEDNDGQIEALMCNAAKRHEDFMFGFNGGGRIDADTEADMHAVFSLMAENYILYSLAQGKNFVYRDTPEGEDAKTVRDLMNDTTFGNAFTGVVAGMVNRRPGVNSTTPTDGISVLTEANETESEGA
jgi:hypothetical protein